MVLCFSLCLFHLCWEHFEKLDEMQILIMSDCRSEFWPTLWAERHQGDLAKRS